MITIIAYLNSIYCSFSQSEALSRLRIAFLSTAYHKPIRRPDRRQRRSSSLQAQVTHTMSADLVWMLTRKQNCFIRQKKGSGGDQLVRPRARTNRFAPPRSSMALGLLRQPLGVSAGAETAVPLSPRFPWLTVRCVLAAQFTNEPNNLMQKHSYKYSGLVSAVPAHPARRLSCERLSDEEDPCARAPPTQPLTGAGLPAGERQGRGRG